MRGKRPVDDRPSHREDQPVKTDRVECFDLTLDDSCSDGGAKICSLAAGSRAPGSSSQEGTRASPGSACNHGRPERDQVRANKRSRVDDASDVVVDNSLATGSRVPGSGRLDATRASPGFIIDRVVNPRDVETIAANWRDVENMNNSMVTRCRVPG